MHHQRLIKVEILFALVNVLSAAKPTIIWGQRGTLTTVTITEDKGLTLRSVQTDEDYAYLTQLLVQRTWLLCRQQFVAPCLVPTTTPLPYHYYVAINQFIFQWTKPWITGPLVIYDADNVFIGCCSLRPSSSQEAGTAELNAIYIHHKAFKNPKNVPEFKEPLAALELIKTLFIPAIAQKGYYFNGAPLKKVEFWWTMAEGYHYTHPQLEKAGFKFNRKMKHPFDKYALPFVYELPTDQQYKVPPLSTSAAPMELDDEDEAPISPRLRRMQNQLMLVLSQIPN